jgi:hypothetical protein
MASSTTKYGPPEESPNKVTSTDIHARKKGEKSCYRSLP